MLVIAAALLALAQAQPWGCGTAVRVDAAQRRATLSQAEIERWLAPLPPLAHWVDADVPFPVRVYFDAPNDQPYAERILAAVAIAYQRTVTEWGFWPPLLAAGEPYYIYVGDPGPGAAAYTAPYLANVDTPHEDAFTYIVVRPGLSDVALDITVAHELNHASQAAMDMSEPPAFFESTATYIESLVFPAGAALAGQLIRIFQSQAHLPLEDAAPGQSDGYEYGASLWLSFLAQVYGSDDPAWIRALWEDSVQVGPTNEPDHRDVLDGWLADRGGQASAIEEFGRWRFFVGSFAEDEQLAMWNGAEVPFTASYNTAQLPVLDAGPQAATRPRPSGCNYVSLSHGASGELPIRFRFEGDAALEWDVSVLEIALDATSSYQPMELGDDARGELRVDPGDLHRAVLVICQSIADGFDLDEKTWPAGDYRYDIEIDVPAPSIQSATPTSIERGVHGSDLVLRGDGFVEGLSVALSGENVAVHDVRVVSPSEIHAKLTVTPAAALGARDVIVTNPGGAFATAAGMLHIVESQPLADLGGGCSLGSRSRSSWWLLASLALFACRRRRLSAAMAAVVVLGIANVAHAGPPSDGYVDSAVHPIRVHYANGANAAVAQEALGYAEEAWQKLFVELGFPEPTTVDDNDAPIPGMWLYVDPTSANLAQAIGDNPATPHTDCLTRIFVSSTSPSSILKSIVVTEMTQATTLTVDCGESVFAWKSAGVALASLVTPDDALFPTVMLPVFQASPHAGLDCTFQGDMFWYHYGAALFWRFVDEAYGAGDGSLLVEVWEAAKQNGTVLATGSGIGELDVPNEPDVLDAVGTVVAPVSFDEAFGEFARWRYFVGTRDDGNHFADGSKWFGAEVAIDRQVTLAELPIVAAAPVMPLADYGSSYIELDLSGFPEDKGIGWAFAGDPLVRWSADMLLVRGDNTAETHSLDVGSGSGVVDVSGFARAVLAVSNLSDGTHDADAPSCNTVASYTYDLAVADLAPPPEVVAVDPSVLTQGARYDVFVSGRDFDAGATVSFGEGVDASAVTFVDATTLAVTLSVRAGAATGLRDVTVQNASGKSDTLAGAITIVPPGDEQVGGCGCRVAKPAPHGAFVLCAFALALVRRRLKAKTSPRRCRTRLRS